MKYCQHCGGEIHEEAVVCIHCGRAVKEVSSNNSSAKTLIQVAKVFMIISCVAAPAFGLLYGSILTIAAAASGTASALIAAIMVMVLCCVPLSWTLPLTLNVIRKQKSNEPIGTGVKVCTLIFVNLVAGILLLCANEDQ